MGWFESAARIQKAPRATGPGRAVLELVGRGTHRRLGRPAHGARVGGPPLRRRADIGSPSPIERELAIDGIDEWISVHLATDVPEVPDATLGGVLCLACADDAAAWTVEVAAGRLRWREGRGPADAVLVGPASDLYLYCWNRRPLEALELTGQRGGRPGLDLARHLRSAALAGRLLRQPLRDRGRARPRGGRGARQNAPGRL